MIDRDLSKMTDEELRALEESLYDDEVNGDYDAWHLRDRVLWEMNHRGMMDRKPA